MLTEHICKFKVKTYDIDFSRKATPKAILGYMEETATEHAKRLGFSYKESLEDGFFWVLRSAKYVLKEPITIDEEISVKTYFAGFSGLKTMRKFEFIRNEKIIGYGYNYWLMIGYENKKPYINQRFVQKVESLYSNDLKPFKLNRIRFSEDMNFSYRKEVMNIDIDMNYHVNNVKYADIIYNAIPMDILQRYTITSLHIDYLKECRLNDSLDLYYKVDDKKLLVEGKKESLVMFKSIITLD